MKRKTGLTNKQWQLLSAYLDNQLSRFERQQIDELLQTSPESRQVLEQLRRTRLILSCLPELHLPRNFFVTPEMVEKPLLPPLISVLRYSSVISSLLLVIVLAIDFIPGLQLASNFKAQELSVGQDLALESTEPSEEPAIIYWGAPAPIAGVYGKGGGGGGEIMGIGGGGTEGVGGAPPAASTAILPLESPADAIESMPDLSEEEQLVPEDSQAVEQERDAAEIQKQREPLSGAGPILGIPPDDMQGKILNGRTAAEPERQAAFPMSLKILEVFLAALALLMAVPVILFTKRK